MAADNRILLHGMTRLSILQTLHELQTLCSLGEDPVLLPTTLNPFQKQSKNIELLTITASL